MIELALVALLGCIALAMRLPSLDEPADNYDEGVYLQSLLLMARGYRLFDEITASQGPLHLDVQLPFFLLFGETVAAGRAASVVLSLATVTGVWWIARQLGGRAAGVTAVLLLVVSPTFLRFSRQALADLPALAPATLAIGAALDYRQTGRRWVLVAAAVLLALGVLMKPIVLPAGLAVAALVWRPSRAGWGDLGLLGFVAMAVIGMVLLLLGPALVLEQVLGFRDEARQAYGWSLSKNWELLVDKLDQEQPGFYLLALVGLVLAAIPPRGPASAVALWAMLSGAMLLAHSPLSYHHMVILLPPLAILGGLAAANAPAALQAAPRARILGVVAVAAVVLYGAGLPELTRRDVLLLSNVDAAGAGSHKTDDMVSAAERIHRLTDRDDFVLTDNPYLAFLADRPVPPELVDPSVARLRSGDLTDEEAVTLAIAYDPEVVALWDEEIHNLPLLMAWVAANYQQNRRFGVGGDGQPRVIMEVRD